MVLRPEVPISIASFLATDFAHACYKSNFSLPALEVVLELADPSLLSLISSFPPSLPSPLHRECPHSQWFWNIFPSRAPDWRVRGEL